MMNGPPQGHAPAAPFGDALGRRLDRAASPAFFAYIVLGAGLLILTAWVVLGTLVYLDQRERMPDNPAWLAPVVMGVFFAPIGLALAVKGFRGRLYRVDVHEGGVVFEDRRGRVVLPWGQLQHSYYEELERRAEMGLGVDVGVGRKATLRLEGARGQTIVIDDRLPGHVAFARRVHEEAARVMLPRYEAALSAGQPVSFGPLTFDRNALYLPQGTLPWSAVVCVRWESRGALAWWALVAPNGQSHADFSTTLVPDQLVLAALLERLGKLAPSDAPTSLVGELVAGARRLLGR
jgi:hypothetical protein